MEGTTEEPKNALWTTVKKEERSNESKIEATSFKITQKTGLDYRS